jgi:hypothetical protein
MSKIHINLYVNCHIRIYRLNWFCKKNRKVTPIKIEIIEESDRSEESTARMTDVSTKSLDDVISEFNSMYDNNTK